MAKVTSLRVSYLGEGAANCSSRSVLRCSTLGSTQGQLASGSTEKAKPVPVKQCICRCSSGRGQVIKPSPWMYRHSPVEVLLQVLVHVGRQRVPQAHVGKQLRLRGLKVEALAVGRVLLRNVEDQVLQVLCGGREKGGSSFILLGWWWHTVEQCQHPGMNEARPRTARPTPHPTASMPGDVFHPARPTAQQQPPSGRRPIRPPHAHTSNPPAHRRCRPASTGGS